MGTTNSSGTLVLTGSWGSSEVGNYTQIWYVAGVAAPTLSFSVKALPTATASIVVTGPKSGNTYYVGDSYTITVTGAPNAPVTVYQNNSQSGQLGTTNSSGSWSTSGTWTTASIGTYVQTWQVAGMSAPTITSFVVAVPYYAISGRVTSGGYGLQDVTISLSACQGGSTITNAAGYYSCSALAFRDYLVTPSKQYYTFVPGSTNLTNLSGPQTANFTGTSITYTISGTTGVAGLSMILSGDVSGATTTNSSGAYVFTVNAGGNYTVAPSKVGYWSTPDSTSFNTVTANKTANFTVAPVTVTLTVTGPQSGTTYQAGDSYVLKVKGPKNQPVTVSQTRGIIMTPLVPWQTDGNGDFSTSGVWGSSETGSYTQTWYAGGNQALPTLSFLVVMPATPTISGISPASASVGGSVTITGTKFGTSRWNSSVTFNGVAAITFTNWTDTSITAVVPAGATTGPVIVNSNGVVASAGYAFTVVSPEPTITSLSPSSIAARGPAFTLTVNGTNYASGATVNWGSTALTTTFVSSSQLTAAVPMSLIASAGNASITVTTSAGTSVPTTFPVVSMTPSVTSLSPYSGTRGSSVTITGSYFGASQGGSTITFNGTPATASGWSDNLIQALVPSGATTGNVVVTVAGLVSNGVNFNVTGPYIANVVSFSTSAASYGTASGTMSTKVSITGTGFGSSQGMSSITFGGLLAPSINDHTYCNNECLWSDTKIQVQVPEGARSGDVVVTVGGQRSNGIPFTIVPPVITSVSQTTAEFYTRIRIIGRNFGADQFISGDKINDDSVTFNGMNGPSVHDQTLCNNNCSWNDQEIDIQVPPGATSGNLIVNVNGMTSNAIPFTITSPAITKLSTDIGVPGTAVDITGVNFGAVQGQGVVYIENTVVSASALAPIISWSDTKVSFTVPPTAVTGFVAVVPPGGAPSSNWVPFTVPGTDPILTQLSPPAGPVGSQVVISGANLGALGTVTFNGIQATSSSWTGASIAVAVPAGATTGNVVVSANGMVTNGLPFTVTNAPVVTGVSPASGRAGTLVTISGARFGPASVTNVLNFKTQSATVAATVTSWSDSLIGAIVPVGAQPGTATVSVVSAGVPSVDTPGASFSVTCCGTVPYITGITTSRGLNWALPGEAGTLVISGGNLFAAINTISIGNSNQGVSMTAQSVSADGTSLTASYIDSPGAPAGTSLVAVSLLSGASNSLPFYVSQPTPPTIAGVARIWYLGSTSVNDNCVFPGAAGDRCYYNSTQLMVIPAPGGATPTPTAPAVWSINPPNGYTAFQCADASCSAINLQVISQPPPCAQVTAQVYLAGVISSQFPITIDWPAETLVPPGMESQYIENLTYSSILYPNFVGYSSFITKQLLSSCTEPMGGISLYETFALPTFMSCKDNTGWEDVPTLGSWKTNIDSYVGLFGEDQITVAALPGANEPDPTGPSTPQLSSIAETYNYQFFIPGYMSQTVVTTPIVPSVQVRYLDHGMNELSTWMCPAK